MSKRRESDESSEESNNSGSESAQESQQSNKKVKTEESSSEDDKNSSEEEDNADNNSADEKSDSNEEDEKPSSKSDNESNKESEEEKEKDKKENNESSEEESNVSDDNEGQDKAKTSDDESDENADDDADDAEPSEENKDSKTDSSSELPTKVLELIEYVYDTPFEYNLTEEHIKQVTKNSDAEYQFKFVYKTKEEQAEKWYDGFALKFHNNWYLSPTKLDEELLEKAFKEVSKLAFDILFYDEEWTKIVLNHIMWPFELSNFGDQDEGMDSGFELVFKYPVILCYHTEGETVYPDKLWVGLDPVTKEVYGSSSEG